MDLRETETEDRSVGMSLIGASSSDVRGAQIRAQRAHAQETEQRHEALRKAALANPRARPVERRRRDDSVTAQGPW